MPNRWNKRDLLRHTRDQLHVVKVAEAFSGSQ